MRRLILIGALIAAVLMFAGAASSSHAAGSACRGGGFTPAWSPSGHELAWSTHLGNGICFARSDGTHQRFMSIPPSLGRPTELRWARPRVLVALTNSDQLFGIVTQPRPHLAKTGPRFAGPGGSTFSLDSRGDVLATGSACCEGPLTILRLNGATTPVGDGTYWNDTPSLSPDGSRVVFEQQVSGSGDGLGIWIARTDASGVPTLLNTGGCPLWSPAGNQIAYVDGGLVLEPTTGSSRVTLTNAVVSCQPQLIAWSPDGRRIAFADSRQHLSVISVRTRHLRTVRFSHELHGFAWSPDSRQLFFSAGNPAGCKSLWRARVTGGETIRISRC